MCRIFTFASLAILVASVALASDDAISPPESVVALERAVQHAIQTAEPGVACVLVFRSADQNRVDLHSPDLVPESYGSGVVIDGTAGLLLTNYHVVRDAKQLYVRVAGRKSSAVEIRAADPRSDLAVLHVLNPTILPLKSLTLGDGDSAQKGQFVVSLANPFAAGFLDGSPSASLGIISNVRRRTLSQVLPPEPERPKLAIDQFGLLLQVDARLNLGCSGGALINLRGELIGLTTAQAALSGSETAGGFAVPMTRGVKRIIHILMHGREVEYGFLGVGSESIPESLHGGVRIVYVIPGSPAQLAGLRKADIIYKVNGEVVRDNNDLFQTVALCMAGTLVRLDILGHTEPVYARLAKYYVAGPIIATSAHPFVRGLQVDYTSVAYQRNQQNQQGIPSGVVVSQVLPDSPADKARLQGMVITHVNNKEVNSPDEFYREVSKLPGPWSLLVSNYEESGQAQQIVLRP